MNIKFIGKYKAITGFEWKDIPKLTIITGVNGVGKSQFLELLKQGLQSGQNPWQTPNYTLEINSNYSHQDVTFWDAKGGGFPNEGRSFHYLELKDIGLEILRYIKQKETQRIQQEINLKYNEQIRSFEADRKQKIQEIESKFRHDPNLKASKIQELNNQYQQDVKPINDAKQFDLQHRTEKTNLEIAKLQHTQNNRQNRSQSYFQNNRQEIFIEEIVNKSCIEAQNITLKDIYYYFPESLLIDTHNILEADRLEVIFYLYQLKKEIGLKEGKTEKDFGTPPWKFLNDALEVANISYRVNQPDTILTDPLYDLYSLPYSIKLSNPGTNEDIGFQDLSSGEKVIMSLALLLYYSENRGQHKKLMLLDEPDAHLHPSMTQKFFDVIDKVLIKKYGVQVIMTTHSPSTLALAPKEEYCEIFQMTKNPTQFIKDESKNHNQTIKLLSSGLILVSPSSKFIFVEDEDDVDFYDIIQENIENDNQLIFIPASNKKNNDSGGKSVVNTWVERFELMNNSIQGLIDKDAGNEVSENSPVHILERYSIENYLIDPIILFTVLNKNPNEEIRPKIDDINIPQGKEHKIIDLTPEQLQKIADYYFDIIKDVLDNDIQTYLTKQEQSEEEVNIKLSEWKEKVEVEFINGIKLQYPKWLLYHRGKNLYKLYQQEIGKLKPVNNIIGNHQLLIALNTLDMIPIELKDFILKIQDS